MRRNSCQHNLVREQMVHPAYKSYGDRRTATVVQYQNYEIFKYVSLSKCLSLCSWWWDGRKNLVLSHCENVGCLLYTQYVEDHYRLTLFCYPLSEPAQLNSVGQLRTVVTPGEPLKEDVCISSSCQHDAYKRRGILCEKEKRLCLTVLHLQ